MKKKILIIGKIPPPIGGVTMHISRLIQKLEDERIPFKHITFQNKLVFIWSLFQYKVIHLHTSNSLLIFSISLFCFTTFKKLLITHHGAINKRKYPNLIRLSIFLTKYPIVLNIQSYRIAKKINQNSILLSAFIPPVKSEVLDKNIDIMISKLREKDWIICSTNAFDVGFINNQETYGISFLIDVFKELNFFYLIVSDPSSNYQSYIINDLKKDIPMNVIFISYPHSYYELLKKVDVMIRATSTDGDSISVKEALYLGKKVICSNVVSRPKETILYNYNDKEDLVTIINNIHKRTNPMLNPNSMDGSISLIQLYKYLLQ